MQIKSVDMWLSVSVCALQHLHEMVIYLFFFRCLWPLANEEIIFRWTRISPRFITNFLIEKMNALTVDDGDDESIARIKRGNGI